MIFEVETLRWVKVGRQLGRLSERNDAPVLDGNRVMVKRGILRRDGQEPTRFDEKITGGHGRSIASIFSDPNPQMM